MTRPSNFSWEFLLVSKQIFCREPLKVWYWIYWEVFCWSTYVIFYNVKLCGKRSRIGKPKDQKIKYFNQINLKKNILLEFRKRIQKSVKQQEDRLVKIFAKSSISDVWQGFKYACEFKVAFRHLELFYNTFSGLKTDIQFKKCFW